MDSQESNTDKTLFYYQQYSSLPDDEVLKILRNHKGYQEDAVAAAVKIAVERELIHSEQDLLAPEFQQVPASRFSLFPPITNAWHQRKLINSIFRFLYLLSFVPIVYGIMSYAEGRLDRALEGIGLGVLWGLLCFSFRKSRNGLLMFFMLLIIFGILVMSCVRIFSRESINLLDLLMAVTGTVLPAYLLLYVKRLLNVNQTEE